MSFFDTLLAKRGYDRAPLPLWKLKVSDAEYEELKSTLSKAAQGWGESAFYSLKKECALYFAEFWRREYIDGPHAIHNVYMSLFNEPQSFSVPNKEDAFYDAAKDGAQRLKIEIYKGETTQYLDSMFYQGGLPMRLVTLNEKNSVWDRFTRGLINRHFDFEELQLGKIATVNKSLKEYCDALSDAIEKEQFLLMPFFCKDEYNPWFVFLKALAHQERTRQRQLHPFSLDWEFMVDEKGGNISSKYIIKGLQRLPEEFLLSQRLFSTQFFSVQLRVNGQAIETYDYQNRFCRYNVFSKHPYHDGDIVALYLHDQENAYLSDNLDLSVPHILYREKDGKYSLGNRLGNLRSLILIPDGWELVDSELPLKDLAWEGRMLRGAFLDESFDGIITVKSSDGIITFDANAKLYWSEILSSPLYLPDIIEPLYDANNLQMLLCSDGDSLPQTVRGNDIEFRSKGDSSWSSKPNYGEVFARVRGRNGEFVTPVSLINVGSLSIVTLTSDKESCSMRVLWPYGSVHCNEGSLKYNNVWSIEKGRCSDSRRIHFTLVPKGKSSAQFTISVRAPFKDFSILDNDGNPVGSVCQVPYGDIDKYQYHLAGQGIKAYSYGSVRRELRWEADKLYVYEDGHSIRPIPFEGSLLTLFDSREVLRSLLDKTSKGILDAYVRVFFEIDQFRRMTLYIKESPFRIEQAADNRLIIQDGHKMPVNYRHALKLFNLSAPSVAQVSIKMIEKGFILPDDQQSWQRALVTGRTRGRILPAMVEWDRVSSPDEREEFRRQSIERITAEIDHAKLGDDTWNRISAWFTLSQQEDIPASSLLDLSCLARDGKPLLLFTFQQFIACKTEEDKETTKGQLLSLATDLAFEWYWIKPYASTLFMTIQSAIAWESPFLKGLYVEWAFSKGMDLGQVMEDLNDDNIFLSKLFPWFNELLAAFEAWLKDIFVLSLSESYDVVPTHSAFIETAEAIAGKRELVVIQNEDEIYIEQNQEDIDDYLTGFFNKYTEPGKSGNEGWFFQRLNAVVAHMKGQIDLFKEPESIRRSIIFCQKSCPYIFLIELNNQLSRIKL